MWLKQNDRSPWYEYGGIRREEDSELRPGPPRHSHTLSSEEPASQARVLDQSDSVPSLRPPASCTFGPSSSPWLCQVRSFGPEH